RARSGRHPSRSPRATGRRPPPTQAVSTRDGSPRTVKSLSLRFPDLLSRLPLAPSKSRSNPTTNIPALC
ncbi:hypothetical protein BGX30_014395, partial [Mortierella sp. GBA39]